jgi:hypothetical protein
MRRQPQRAAQDNTVARISAVKTPLNFLVLGLLMVEGTIGGLILSVPDYRGPLIWTVILSIPAFVAIVVSLAVFRPEALTGDRPLQAATAHRLGSDLYLALDGPLKNLEPEERLEAWATVADVITSDERADATYLRFCEAVAVRLRKLASIGNHPLKTVGPVRSDN